MPRDKFAGLTDRAKPLNTEDHAFEFSASSLPGLTRQSIFLR
jgi:hypothetical protein